MKKLISVLVVLGMFVGAATVGAEETIKQELTNAVVTSAEDILKDTLVGIINGVVSAKDFLLEQTPEVLQQLLMWKMLESIMQVIGGAILLLSIFLYWKYVAKNWTAIEKWNGEPLFVIIGIVLTLTNLAVGICYIMNLTWLQIWVAPKVYLIEYAAQLVK